MIQALTNIAYQTYTLQQNYPALLIGIHQDRTVVTIGVEAADAETVTCFSLSVVQVFLDLEVNSKIGIEIKRTHRNVPYSPDYFDFNNFIDMYDEKQFA